MSESTFRAVVASVLVGALVLAVITSAVFLARSPESSPGTSVVPSAEPSPTPSPVPKRTPAAATVLAPVFGTTDVTGVGLIPRGGASAATLVFRFLESNREAIPDAAGSFRVTLTDHAGRGMTVAFVGTPSVEAPGSLGATARLVSPNVLLVSIVAADTASVELISVGGLRISASSTAALGPVKAELGTFTGSLVTGAARNVLATPGTVVASP